MIPSFQPLMQLRKGKVSDQGCTNRYSRPWPEFKCWCKDTWGQRRSDCNLGPSRGLGAAPQPGGPGLGPPSSGLLLACRVHLPLISSVPGAQEGAALQTLQQRNKEPISYKTSHSPSPRAHLAQRHVSRVHSKLRKSPKGCSGLTKPTVKWISVSDAITLPQISPHSD